MEDVTLKLIDKIEQKHPNWGIPNLMMHISILTAIVYVMHYVLRSNIIGYLYLDRTAVMSGQVWRLLSFVLIPASSSPLYFLLSIYFYYFLGTALESSWGAFKFTAYYVVCMLGTIIVAFLFPSGMYSGYYINLSIFLAFAYLYPNYEVLVFYILPLKVKYLAYIDIALLTFSFLTENLSGKFSIIASLLGLIIFFGTDIYRRIKAWIRRQKYKNKF